ncbi:hypothetical protein [Hoeflea alexandrii]
MIAERPWSAPVDEQEFARRVEHLELAELLSDLAGANLRPSRHQVEHVAVLQVDPAGYPEIEQGFGIGRAQQRRHHALVGKTDGEDGRIEVIGHRRAIPEPEPDIQFEYLSGMGKKFSKALQSTVCAQTHVSRLINRIGSNSTGGQQRRRTAARPTQHHSAA